MTARNVLPLLARIVFLTCLVHRDVLPPRVGRPRGLTGGLLTGPYIGPDSFEEGSTEGGAVGELLRIGADGGAGIPCETSLIISPPRRVFAILLSCQENLFSRA
jgi:hypothetical protein